MASDAVWALDLGNSSLKALRLRLTGERVQVSAFDYVRHTKILSGKGVSDSEREELIALSLRQFVERNDVPDDVIIAVPSQNSFARFVTLPPVEMKKVPEIVKFEAVQQIPFNINEVQWDWQMMTAMDAPEKKVGLFAIKNEVVNTELEHFSREDLGIRYVQMAPMALYNYLIYDRPELFKSDERPVVILNIGAEITDLVVCTKSAVWQRCILIAGNTFTRAIADAFKINFEKAEKLKRTAAVSKYARQILQAMRPVFTDLAGEIQKSLGFYTNSNPNSKFDRIVAMGGGTRLRGLLKYLQQSLQIPVERPDQYQRLVMGPGVSAAKFHESVSEFAVVYGLALQGVGMARIESNLLPRSIERSMAWAMKLRIFNIAACLLLLASLLALGRTVMDKVGYDRKSDVRRQIDNVIRAAEDARKQLQTEQGRSNVYLDRMKKVFGLFRYRDAIPLVNETLLSALPNAENNPEQRVLYEAFEAGDIETVLTIPRKDRRQLFVTHMWIMYADDLAKAQFGGIKIGVPEAQDSYSRGFEGFYMEPQETTESDTTDGVPNVGFLVIMEGYSPYREIGDLIDPLSVEDQPQKWGLVTRLLHMGQDSLFILYKKSEVAHFKLDKGPVETMRATTATMPTGIGVYPDTQEDLKGVADNEGILIDPMTKEVISRISAVDRNGRPRFNQLGRPVLEENDHWFRLKFKLAWKDAPVKE